MAAQKFEEEDLEGDLKSMLPNKWVTQLPKKREEWKEIIRSHNELFDINMLSKLREAKMSLDLLKHMYRIWKLTKAIAVIEREGESPTKKEYKKVKNNSTTTPTKVSHGSMLYHVYKQSQHVGLECRAKVSTCRHGSQQDSWAQRCGVAVIS